MLTTMSGGIPATPGTRLPSPRSRILSTAIKLFYRKGINATGIGQLVEVAGVSKRTLYQLFDSKDDLIVAYLTAMSGTEAVTNEAVLDRTDLAPRDRLLALFDRSGTGGRFRGCPLHNASVELTDPTHPGRPVIVAHKRDFLRKLVETAHEAGAPDPDGLARQLFSLFEGAMALCTSMGDPESFDWARPAATLLIGAAVPAVAGQAV